MDKTFRRTTPLRDYLEPRGSVARLTDFEGKLPSEVNVRLGDRIVALNQQTIGAITGVPDQIGGTWGVLTNTKQRRLMFKGLVKEEYLNDKRRSALFTFILLSLVIVWGLVSIILLITSRTALGVYQSSWGLFLYSLGTSLFLPTPFELLLSRSVNELGYVATIAIAAVAKTFGAWMVLLVGDRAASGIENATNKKGLGAKIFNVTKRFAQKFGYGAIFVFFAIPFMSDTAPLFVVSVLRMKKGLLLGVIFLAIVLRSIIYLVILRAF